MPPSGVCFSRPRFRPLVSLGRRQTNIKGILLYLSGKSVLVKGKLLKRGACGYFGETIALIVGFKFLIGFSYFHMRPM